MAKTGLKNGIWCILITIRINDLKNIFIRVCNLAAGCIVLKKSRYAEPFSLAGGIIYNGDNNDFGAAAAALC